jgi:hypothetical protein
MDVGVAQQNAPFRSATNLANIIAGIKAPDTVTSQTQTSPLTQAATLANTLQGTGAAGGLGSLLFGSAAQGSPYLADGKTPNPNYKPASGGLFSPQGTTGITGALSNWFGGGGSGSGIKTDSSGNLIAGTYPTADGGTITINSDGSKVITDANGTVSNFDSQGNTTAPVLTPIPEQGLPPDTNPGNPDNPSPIPDFNPIVE